MAGGREQASPRLSLKARSVQRRSGPAERADRPTAWTDPFIAIGGGMGARLYLAIYEPSTRFPAMLTGARRGPGPFGTGANTIC
jgi:hypothetical protein